MKAVDWALGTVVGGLASGLGSALMAPGPRGPTTLSLATDGYAEVPAGSVTRSLRFHAG
jgi:hypothetical protein